MARRDRNQPQRIEFEINGLSERVVGKIQLRMLQVLAIETPVKTGFARSGWTPATGTPITDRRPRPVDEKEARRVAGIRRTENQARANAIATGYKLRQGAAFITNAVPYLKRLNEGYSAQAPAKYIESGIEKVVRSFGGQPL